MNLTSQVFKIHITSFEKNFFLTFIYRPISVTNSLYLHTFIKSLSFHQTRAQNLNVLGQSELSHIKITNCYNTNFENHVPKLRAVVLWHPCAVQSHLWSSFHCSKVCERLQSQSKEESTVQKICSIVRSECYCFSSSLTYMRWSSGDLP